MSLYLTTQRSLEINKMIELNDGEVPEELFDEIINSEGRFEDQVSAVLDNIKEDEALIAAARKEKKRIDALIKRKTLSIDSKKRLIYTSMENLKMKRVDMGVKGTYTISKKPSVIWDDVDVESLDPEYVRVKKEIDKDLLKKEYGDEQLKAIGAVIGKKTTLTLRS